MQRLQAEVRALNKEDLTLEVLSHQSFMTACLSETLRIYPAAPIALFRATPKGGNVIDGQWIPERVSALKILTCLTLNNKNTLDPCCSTSLCCIPQPLEL